jgi:dihydroflavonol-4-reductase
VTAPRPAYLVTGATGFLGRHVLHALTGARPEARIAVLVRDAASWHSQSWREALGAVEVIAGPLLPSERWEQDPRLSELEGIFHLAAEVRHSRSGVDRMLRTNVEGAAAMVRLAARSGARVVFASTSGTVACSTDPGYAPDEDSPPCEDVVGRWPYYASKIRAEAEARELSRQLGVELVIIRPPVLLGPGDHRYRSTSNVLRLLRGRLPFLFDGSIHFVDVRDVASAMVAAMLRPEPRPIYHLPGTVCTLDAFFRMAAAAADIEPGWRRIPARLLWLLAKLNDLTRIRAHFLPDPVVVEMGMHHWGLSSKFAGDLGFHPRPPEVTIADTIDWMRENHPELRPAIAQASGGGTPAGG